MAIISSGSFTSAASPVDKLLNIVSDFDTFRFFVQGDASGSIWTAATASTPGSVKEAYWFRGMAVGTALATVNTNGLLTDQKAFIAAPSGFTPFSYDQPISYPVLTITSITKANPAVVTTSANHNLATGDTVRIYNNLVMKQLGGLTFTVTVTGATTFTIGVNTNTANFTAETAANAQKIFPGNEFFPLAHRIVGMTAANPCVITTATNHGYVANQIIRVHVPSAFGMVQANNLVVHIASVTATTITTDFDSTSFTAFAWPAATAVPISYAEVNPIGEASSILTQAETNIGFRGIIIPAALQSASALSFWVAEKSDQYVVG
jgi:hypothetical protein